ncbi:DUF4169 family protein [Arenibaculum pallidiluteum]|uniref:DUF4169 family protein n=1 Tax=Arenibaculum pallidiluteum TaxID=2812559 RepID=UPI001A97B457|nr:DUF4169 family protein [Arenibaculum pallidiluteum]
MGEVVNLNRFRKERARRDKETLAEQNRTRFGRTKEERRRDREESQKIGRDLDGKKLDDPA